LALALVMLLPAPTFGQSDQGRIAGSVRDQTNAFVAGTTVKVINEKTGEERTAVTHGQGLVVVTGLRPSTYTTRVELSGFTTIEYPATPLVVGQELTLDFELKPAGVEEAVTV